MTMGWVTVRMQGALLGGTVTDQMTLAETIRGEVRWWILEGPNHQGRVTDWIWGREGGDQEEGRLRDGS